MDAKPAFDLTEALADWRQRLRAVPNLSDDDVTEMESHLLDSVEEWQAKGLSELEAFQLACQRFGDSRAVGMELAELKSGPRTIPPQSPPLPPRQPSPPSAPPIVTQLEVRRGCGIFFVGFGVLLILAAIAGVFVSQLLPKKYLGKVVMELQRYQAGESTSPEEAPSPTFIASQFKLITSEETLNRVIDKLELVKRWPETRGSRDAAYSKLLDMVKTEDERGTDLVNISVLSTDRTEAAELANAIASSYAERRNAVERKRVDNTVVMLDLQKKEQMEKVEKSRAKMLELMGQAKIADFGPVPGPSGEHTEGAKYTRNLVAEAMRQEMELEKQVGDWKAQLSILKEKKEDDLVSSSRPLSPSDPVTTNLLPKYLNDLAELKAMMGTGRGENHPQVVTLKERISATRKMLDSGMAVIIGNLEAKLQMAEATLANMKKIKYGVPKDAIQASPDHLAYTQARDDYELQSQLLLKMINSQATSRLAMCIPKSPVTIHEFAVAPSTHAKPDVTLQLALCGAALLAGMGSLWLGNRIRRGT